MREVSRAPPEFGSLPVREGELLAGKYRIGPVLGFGGMGIVIEARHEQLDQRLAIKFIRSDALGNADAVERFVREARAAAKLRSEHAAKVLDVGTLESGVPYMVMELLEGSDLAQVLEERGPLPIELAADWIVQACEAVAEAHAAGIVHRDLKPQNLFLALTVGGAAKVKVLDFGVAKSMASSAGRVGALTGTRATLGSPLYMAPEQMRSSRDVDARADVWALGVVLFELLTQRWPFEAQGMPELCLKVVTDPPLSLAGLRPDVPRSLVDVVERCLAKDPAARFANAGELAVALESFVPPASRAIVARAQMAMGGAAPSLPRSGETSRGVQPDPSQHPVGTPSAWGSGQVEGKGAEAARPKSRRAFWAVSGAGAIAVAALVAVLFLVRATINRPSSSILEREPRPAASAAVSVSAPSPSAPLRVLLPVSPDQAPAPLTAGTSPDVLREAPPAAVGPAIGSTAPAAAPPPKAPPAAPPRASPPSIPPVRDDDIPSLR